MNLSSRSADSANVKHNEQKFIFIYTIAIIYFNIQGEAITISTLNILESISPIDSKIFKVLIVIASPCTIYFNI